MLDIDISDLRRDKKANLPKNMMKEEREVLADFQEKIAGAVKDAVDNRKESLDENCSGESENSSYDDSLTLSLKMDFEVETESEVNLECIKNEKLESEKILAIEDLTVQRKEVDIYTNCQICEYSTQHRMNLERHYITHFSEEMNTIVDKVSSDLKCSLCDHESKSKVDMKMHLALPHCYLNKILQAKGYKAFSKQKNKRKTGKIRKAKIIEAATAAIRKHSLLKQRNESHQNDDEIKSLEQIPDPCSDVTKTAIVETLSATRHFACDQCSKTFGQRGAFLFHKKLHIGRKPFKCNYCDHTTKHKGNLKVHVKRRHKTE